MAVVYSTLEDPVSIDEELEALRCAYEGLSFILDKLQSDCVDVGQVEAVLDLVISRLFRFVGELH